MEKIKSYLLSQKDQKYRDFTLPLLPNIDEKTFIGVRLPILKKYAKDLDVKTREEFLKELPHEFHEENILHALFSLTLKTTMSISTKLMPSFLLSPIGQCQTHFAINI